jgi:hypothetical protein
MRVTQIIRFRYAGYDSGFQTLWQPRGSRLGLDGERSRIVVDEANVFTRPGPDLRFLPSEGPEISFYWFLPPGFFRVVRDRFLSADRAKKAAVVATNGVRDAHSEVGYSRRHIYPTGRHDGSIRPSCRAWISADAVFPASLNSAGLFPRRQRSLLQ